MNLDFFKWPARKSASASTRFVAATQAENKAAQYRRDMVELQLAVAAAVLTPEQKAAAIARAMKGSR